MKLMRINKIDGCVEKHGGGGVFSRYVMYAAGRPVIVLCHQNDVRELDYLHHW